MYIFVSITMNHYKKKVFVNRVVVEMFKALVIRSTHMIRAASHKQILVRLAPVWNPISHFLNYLLSFPLEPYGIILIWTHYKKEY